MLRFLKRYFHILPIIKFFNRRIRSISSRTHQLQFLIEWGVDNPEYFDHFLDQHYLWTSTRNSFPWERGVFSSLAIKSDSNVLDLCCGDGHITYHFYSLRAKSIFAIDFDRNAINHARKNFNISNIEFHLGDIRTDIPDRLFDNIIWDAAIEHFTENEITNIMAKIKSVLKEDGILSGYTIIESTTGKKHLHQHEYEFRNKEDLARFLTPYFKKVQVFTTEYPSRTNLYFYATDSILPFENDWNLII